MTNQAETLAIVRRAVRDVIEDTPNLRDDPDLKRSISERMVGVSMAAAELIAEEQRLDDEIGSRVKKAPKQAPLATAQAAGDIHGQTAVRSAAGVLRGTRDAIDFPGFVTSLINGLFQAIQTSSMQQLDAVRELLEAVQGTTAEFSTTQISAPRAVMWAANRFDAFTTQQEEDELLLVLRSEADMPDPEELRDALEADQDEVASIDEDDLNETLVPLVRRKMARDRQSMLATMIMMGLQRVVVDDGKLHASMRLQVDARSTAEQTAAEQFDARVESEASGRFGLGPWGASAKMSTSVGYVRSDEQFTREDISVSAGLRSSVDLRFRTEPMDVTRMANTRGLRSIQDRSMVPERERELGSLIASEPERVTKRASLPTPPGQGSLISKDRGTMEEARAAQEEAQRREAAEKAATVLGNPTGASSPGALAQSMPASDDAIGNPHLAAGGMQPARKIVPSA